jgi:regulator of RNase E activity RraA
MPSCRRDSHPLASRQIVQQESSRRRRTPPMAPGADSERASALAMLYTGAVADILDELGLREQCLPADIRPLQDGMKVAGPVYTVRGRSRPADDGTDPRYRQMDMLDGIFSGAVVVIDPGDEVRAAHWGELMSHTAKARGATGVVIAGGVRDTPEILRLGFPCFRRYHSPLTAVHRYDITDFGVPVRIGSVAIAPGDFVLGDVDGVLVIPEAAVDEVIAKARSVREREDIVRAALDRGGSIRDLFEQHRVF